MNVYTVGTLVEIDATFTDSNGNPADPTAVTAYVRLPDGTLVDKSGVLVHSGLGEYSLRYTVEVNGQHQYRFAGTGAVIAANEGSFMGQSTFPT